MYNEKDMTVGTFCALLRRYRTELMGIAIIWVLTFHTSWELIEPFYSIIHKGYGGVDIFMFLSGFGVWHSLRKDGNILRFYWRRMKKIYPSYLIVLFTMFCRIYSAYRMQGYSKAEMFDFFFANVFFTQFLTWKPVGFNWYISAIVYFYLFSPLFYFLIRKKLGIPLLIGSLFFDILFFGIGPYLMAFTRLFLFLLGMFTAYLGETKKDLKINLPVLFTVMVIGIFILVYTQIYMTDYLDYYGLWFQPYRLIIPGLLVCLCLLLDRINRDYPFLKMMGRASFEIYLINVTFKDDFFLRIAYYLNWSQWMWPIGIVIMAALGLLFHFLIDKAMDLAEKIFHELRKKILR